MMMDKELHGDEEEIRNAAKTMFAAIHPRARHIVSAMIKQLPPERVKEILLKYYKERMTPEQLTEKVGRFISLQGGAA